MAECWVISSRTSLWISSQALNWENCFLQIPMLRKFCISELIKFLKTEALTPASWYYLSKVTKNSKSVLFRIGISSYSIMIQNVWPIRLLTLVVSRGRSCLKISLHIWKRSRNLVFPFLLWLTFLLVFKQALIKSILSTLIVKTRISFTHTIDRDVSSR